MVTGDSNDNPSTGTPRAVAEAATRTAPRPSVTSAAVVGNSALTGNASAPLWTYQPSAVRTTAMLSGHLARDRLPGAAVASLGTVGCAAAPRRPACRDGRGPVGRRKRLRP